MKLRGVELSKENECLKERKWRKMQELALEDTAGSATTTTASGTLTLTEGSFTPSYQASHRYLR